MIHGTRLGHVTFTTPDIEKMVDYYTLVVGLHVVERAPNSVLLATKLGHEAILLERGGECRLKSLALQTRPDDDPLSIKADLAAEGISVEKRGGITPGVVEALVFTDPNGTLIELHNAFQFHPVNTSDTGVAAFKLGHVAHRVTDVKRMSSFYQRFFGLRLSDWGDHFAFLRCGADHHTFYFVQYDEPRFHHIAFEVKDWAELQRSIEIVTKHRIQLVWGPLRHIVGHNIAAYHRNPDDVRVEFFCEMDQMQDDALGYWEPRPWHEEVPLYPKQWPKETLRSAWGFGSYGTFPGYP